MENNYAWLNRICHNTLVDENWYNEKVLYFNSYKAILSASFGVEYINAHDIIEISHEGYVNENTSYTWLELLEKLSRFYRFKESPSNLCKEDIVRVIHSEEVFPPDFKRVYEWNGSYYISTGHHRLMVAKFLDVEQIKVFVSHVRELNK